MSNPWEDKPTAEEESQDAFDENELLPVPGEVFAVLIEMGAFVFDPRSLKNLSIAFGEPQEAGAEKANAASWMRAPRWVRAVFPFETEGAAYKVLSKDAWTRFFALCRAEPLFRGAAASVLVLKGERAFASYVQRFLKNLPA